MPERLLPVLSLFSVVIALLCPADMPAFAESRYVTAGTTEQPADLGKVEGVLTFRGRTGEGPMKDAWFAFTLPNATRVQDRGRPTRRHIRPARGWQSRRRWRFDQYCLLA
ncbi:hypothetical protein [Agrobacterium radiobacter]|uniref:hypothetical protein n=1 Tax=Agrobacterium radiobacter TaxID=362 RepID=UPI003CE513FF